MLFVSFLCIISSLSSMTTNVHGWTSMSSSIGGMTKAKTHSSTTTSSSTIKILSSSGSSPFLTTTSLHPPPSPSKIIVEDLITTTPTSSDGEDVNSAMPSSTTMTTSVKTNAFPKHFHILILPGFGTKSEDYTRDGSLAPNLVNRGWNQDQVHVLPVNRIDWINAIILGALDGDYLKGMATPLSAAYLWYIHRVSDEIRKIDQQVKKDHGENAKAKIILVGHSAGGWLARAAVGYGCSFSHRCSNGMCEFDEECEQRMDDTGIEIDMDNLLGIVTLGSPNLPSPIGSIDMTGGALRATNTRFPGAYFSDKLFYVTAAGNAVTSRWSIANELAWATSATASAMVPESLQKLAHWSYLQVSGKGRGCGDGIVPVSIAHLEGAIQINLEKVFHAAELSSSSRWYGSDTILDQWLGSVNNLLENLV